MTRTVRIHDHGPELQFQIVDPSGGTVQPGISGTSVDLPDGGYVSLTVSADADVAVLRDVPPGVVDALVLMSARPGTLDWLKHLENLQSLTVMLDTPGSLRGLSQVSDLTSLNLSSGASLDPDDVREISQLPLLETLQVAAEAPAPLLHVLPSLKNLKTLILQCAEVVDDEDLGHITGLSELSTLAVSRSAQQCVSIELARAFASLPSLRQLQLRIGDLANLDEVIGWRQLEMLELATGQLPAHVVAAFGLMPQLHFLSLSVDEWPNGQLDALSQLPRLQSLSITSPHIEVSHLHWLRGTGVRDLTLTGAVDCEELLQYLPRNLRSLNVPGLTLSQKVRVTRACPDVVINGETLSARAISKLEFSHSDADAG